METFIHTKNDQKNIVIKYIISLIPLYLYGTYKNGFLLFNKNLISFMQIFKLFYLALIGIFINSIVSIIFKKKLKLDLDFLDVLIIPIFMPPNINYLLYTGTIFVGLILFNLIKKVFNLNKVVFLKIIITILIIILGLYTYQNKAESLNIYLFNKWDLLFGRGISGLASSNIVILFLVYIYLMIVLEYKYLSALMAIIFFAGLSIIFKDYSFLLNSYVYAGFILCATDYKSSPIDNKWSIIYGSVIGIMCYFLTKYFSPYEGVFLSIFISAFIFEFICKIIKKVL